MILFKKSLRLITILALICLLISCDKHDLKPAPKSDQFIYQSATELTGAIRRGEITCVDLLNFYLDRIKRYNDDINAVVAMDVKAARARAAEADKALTRGEDWGPLHGLPMTVKDVFEVATTALMSSL